MENIKNVIVYALAAIGAYFSPIQSIFFGVLWIFFLNFVFGLINGIVVNGEAFSLRKAFTCLVEAMVLFLLMASIFFIGDRIGNKAGAMQCISAIVYALIYFYAVNILKNIKGLFPANRLIKFIYYVVSIEFVKKIPYLQDFNLNNPDNGKN